MNQRRLKQSILLDIFSLFLFFLNREKYSKRTLIIMSIRYIWKTKLSVISRPLLFIKILFLISHVYTSRDNGAHGYTKRRWSVHRWGRLLPHFFVLPMCTCELSLCCYIYKSPNNAIWMPFLLHTLFTGRSWRWIFTRLKTIIYRFP